MLRHAVLAAALATVACQGPPPPIIAREWLVLGPLTGGMVAIRGLPGAVMAPGAITVTITVYREAPAPWTLLHLGAGNLAIHSTYAPVDGERGFAEGGARLTRAARAGRGRDQPHALQGPGGGGADDLRLRALTERQGDGSGIVGGRRRKYTRKDRGFAP